MRTVKSMIEALETFPPDAECYAYEGEVSVLVIMGAGDIQLGSISAHSAYTKDTKIKDYRIKNGNSK